MTLVPKREYLALLLGDVTVFTLSLFLALTVRYFEWPDERLIRIHALPFGILFVVWVGIFFLAGLYGKHTRIFRRGLLKNIIGAQMTNVMIAALFFFFIPVFGIAPKTILIIYLCISSLLIFLWRVTLFPRLKTSRPQKGILIASGADADVLVEELKHDHRYALVFEDVIDTKRAPSHEVIQKACRVSEEDGLAFLVVDFSDKALSTALPIVYDAAFQKRRFALIDIRDLYQEVFNRVPLSFVNYEWVLGHLARSRSYDNLKRIVDIILALIGGALSLPAYPFVALAIKIDDGGPVLIRQERVGRYQKPISIIKFRSMSGNDKGEYGSEGKTKLTVTRVGKWLRISRLDEWPQIWNVLWGDLSFVGPRPELPSLASHYRARISYYDARYLLQPGLTGWAQIHHDRHPHHGVDVAETKEKLSYDLFYFRYRSLFLDLFIILQTFRIIFTARGS